MGYLPSDANEVIIDAVLTKFGRQKLAAQGTLGITRFALSDDEIDYSLYDVANPNGTDYYDTAIKMMPILEALPANADSLRYKLFTNDSTVTKYVASIIVGNSDATIVTAPGLSGHTIVTLTPSLSSANQAVVSQDIIQSTYYVATLTAFEAYALQDVILIGTVPALGSAGYKDSTISAINSAQTYYNTQNLANGASGTQTQAAGYTFTFQIKNTSAITTATSFGLNVVAVSPINAQQANLTLYVNSMLAASV
jgi:hypothetical protein